MSRPEDRWPIGAPRQPAGPARGSRPKTFSPPPITRVEVLGLALILALALGMRLWQLGEIPPGLHVDEGHNGVDALAIARGWRPLYLPGNDGREALYSYLQAPLVTWLGPTAFALRLASALLGVAGVAAAWVWVRGLPLGPAMGPATGGQVEGAVERRRTFARIAALATAAATATTYWHLHFSRIAIRGILLPLIASLAAWVLWRALRATRGPERAEHSRTGLRQRAPATRWWAATGAAYALALYAHPAGRLLAFVPLPPILWLAWRARRARDRAALRVLLRGAGAAALTAAVVLLPLGLWAARHPEVFLAHSVSVSVLDPAVSEGAPLRRIGINAWRTVRALAWKGSGSWYHNLRDRPVLDPWTALLWAGGLGWLLWGAWRAGGERGRWASRPVKAAADGARFARGDRSRIGEHDPASPGRPLVGAHDPALVAVFLGSWWLLMALPTVLTSGAPNFSRAVGLMPALFVPTGLAVAVLGTRMAASMPRRRWRRPVAALTLASVLTPGALLAGRDHFERYAGAPEPDRVFDATTAEEAAALRSFAQVPGARILTSPIVEQRAVLHFLTDGLGPTLLPVPHPPDIYVPVEGQAYYAFDAGEESAAATAFAERWLPRVGPAPERDPSSPLDHPAVRAFHAPDGSPTWLRIDAPAPPPMRQPSPWAFGDTLALLAVEQREGGPARPPPFRAGPGETLRLVLWWRVLRASDRDWTRFTHLVGPADRSFGQQDGAPFGGRLPTSRWAPGDIVGTEVPLTVSPEAPVGETLALRVGWYEPATGERLPLPGDADAAAEVARIEIRR